MDLVKEFNKDELAIDAYWIGRKQEGKQLNEELLAMKALPAHERARLLSNLRLCQ